MGRKENRAARISGPSVRRLTDAYLIEHLPARIRAQIIDLLGPYCPVDQGFLAAHTLGNVVLSFNEIAPVDEVDVLSGAALPQSLPHISQFGTAWRVILERLRDVPLYFNRKRVGRLIITPDGGFPPVVIPLTAPRFICAYTMVMRAKDACQGNVSELSPANVMCALEQFEWAFQAFAEAKEKSGASIVTAATNRSEERRKMGSCDDIFDTGISNYLFRMHQALKQKGVGAILAGMFPAGYYWNTNPANVDYRDLRGNRIHVAK